MWAIIARLSDVLQAIGLVTVIVAVLFAAFWIRSKAARVTGFFKVSRA